MLSRPASFQKLLTLLRRLPSVGPKMSERIAYFLLKLSEDELENFTEAIEAAHREVRPCSICGYWDSADPCRICADPERDKTLLCVVESSQDIVAISQVRNFNGVYHVLGGTLSPLDGVGPQDLQIEPLLRRIESEPLREVILAMNLDVEGEATAQYLAQQITQARRNGLKVSRPAQGLPAGGELEYMDELTLTHALAGRREIPV